MKSPRDPIESVNHVLVEEHHDVPENGPLLFGVMRSAQLNKPSQIYSNKAKHLRIRPSHLTS